jgi:hypothetical protein
LCPTIFVDISMYALAHSDTRNQLTLELSCSDPTKSPEYLVGVSLPSSSQQVPSATRAAAINGGQLRTYALNTCCESPSSGFELPAPMFVVCCGSLRRNRCSTCWPTWFVFLVRLGRTDTLPALAAVVLITIPQCNVLVHARACCTI